jgi:hypothetical protein
MADEAKDLGKQPITREQLQAVLADLIAKKDKASEYAGHVGKATQQACEQYGLDKNALSTVRRIKGMEEAKAQSFLRGVIDYAWKAGLFDQFDAFDPMADLLRAILSEIEKNDQPRPAAGFPGDDDGDDDQVDLEKSIRDNEAAFEFRNVLKHVN